MQVQSPVIRVVDRYQFLPGEKAPRRKGIPGAFRIGDTVRHKVVEHRQGVIVGVTAEFYHVSINGWVTPIDKRFVIGVKRATEAKPKPVAPSAPYDDGITPFERKHMIFNKLTIEQVREALREAQA